MTFIYSKNNLQQTHLVVNLEVIDQTLTDIKLINSKILNVYKYKN